MMDEWGIRLDALLHYYSMKLKQYQPKFLWTVPGEKSTADNETNCNGFARDFLDSREIYNPETAWASGWGGLIAEYNYDISPINPGKSIKDCLLNTSISICYRNLKFSANMGHVKRYEAKEAQSAANKGEVIHVISAKYNHEAIVCSDPNIYDPDKGPMLGQAGAYCGCLYLGDKRTFGAYGSVKNILGDIIFIGYQKIS